jgi:DNA-binding transcriptional ArsR family regulator
MVVDKRSIDDDEGATDLLFGALADPTRRDIFRRAHEGRFSVSALAREYPISVAAVQKHVTVLRAIGPAFANAGLHAYLSGRFRSPPPLCFSRSPAS